MQSNEAITVRDMRPGEEKTLAGLARQAFTHSPLEMMAISTPKQALVVESNGAVAGAMFLKEFKTGAKKAGYLDVGFVVKEYRGHGVGRVLYPAAIQRLREMGCDPITAMVIDDNAASWKTLENQGFGTPSLVEMIQLLGFGRAMVLWLRTMMCIACGARFWMSGPVKERSSAGELLSFLWVNVLLFLPGLFWMTSQSVHIPYKLAAFPAVLVWGVLFGALGCLAAGNTWRFLFPRCGMLLTLVVNSIKGLFPMAGRWYLKDPQATQETRRAMGIQACVEWLGVIALFCLGAFVLQDNLFFYYCAAFSANLLVYRIIPFLPFGGMRVWRWNKAVFAAFTLASAALVFFTLNS